LSLDADAPDKRRCQQVEPAELGIIVELQAVRFRSRLWVSEESCGWSDEKCQV
jgi:hypothetical protein